ncbi:small cell adhesion glycoprotein [Neofelis nebulosa]|uniref:small cell adhesion glycoprotein n=1 Tax=Neofelis nebulosa TaxID=61452 RepID=UPI00272A9172|nr:small cell adhesion glycoprotein [Neofelis nebulosa]
MCQSAGPPTPTPGRPPQLAPRPGPRLPAARCPSTALGESPPFPPPGEFKRTRGAAPGPFRGSPSDREGEHAEEGTWGGREAQPNPGAASTRQSPRPRERRQPRAAGAFRRGRSETPAPDGRTHAPRAAPGALCRSALSPLAAMTSLLTTPSPGEEPMTTPILQTTEALSPKAEASTALIAVVITVVFLTLLSVVILIFFYLYKNKGSYVTYEPAEGEPSAILQMESDSAKGREKEEYFI